MGVDPSIVESLNIVNRVSQSISLFTMHGFGEIHEFVEGRIRIEDAHIVAEVRLKFRTVTRPVVLALTDGLYHPPFAGTGFADQSHHSRSVVQKHD